MAIWNICQPPDYNASYPWLSWENRQCTPPTSYNVNVTIPAESTIVRENTSERFPNTQKRNSIKRNITIPKTGASKTTILTYTVVDDP